MRHSKVFYCYDGATAFTSALLNVKYLFGESEEYEGALYSLAGQSGEISLYQAEDTLPFGYVAPCGYDVPQETSKNGLRLQNRMVRELGLDNGLFVKCDKEAAEGKVSFSAGEPGVYYGILTASGTKKIRVTGGRPYEQEFKDLKAGAVFCIGALEEGQKISIVNADEEGDPPKADIYRMDEAVLDEALALLGRQHLEHVEYDSTHLSGTLSLAEPGRLILSVPHEDGWSVKLNGEPVEPELFGGTFMAFDLQPGEYTLKMHYVPAGRGAGLAVSAASILCFLGILVLKTTRGRRKPNAGIQL